MEIRKITGLVMGDYTDEIIKISYIKFLTNSTLESVKLPTNLENYRHKHLLSPEYILELEIVKTKKNWILKNLLSSKKICTLCEFEDYIKFSQMMKILSDSLRENQQTPVLEWVLAFFAHIPVNQMTVGEFESELQRVLGFSV